MPPGGHLCLFYEKDPAEQMPALIPFIREGLSRNERFIYVADDQMVDELAGRLERSGINVGGESERGALKLWTRREWRQPGELCSEKKSLQVLQFIDEASKSGFKGIRFAIEMTWTLGPDISARQLEHWEATLNTIFVPDFPGRMVCQYNRSRLSPEAMLAALRTHPLIILGDQVCPNLFYEAPLILDGNATSTAARVEWMISQLKRARAAAIEREELIQKRASLIQAELARKKIENTMSLMPIAVYTCDEQGRITFFNRMAVELWGCEPRLNDVEETFCGSFRLLRPDGSLLPYSESPMAAAVRTGRPARNEEVIIERPDGSRVIVNANIDPLYDTDGRRCGAINAFQDVTAQKQAERASRHLAAIVESSDDAIVSKDLNGIITSWNKGAERLFGYAAEEVLGKPITILIPPERYDEEPEILARIRRGERIEHYETVRRRKDGSLVEISLMVSPVKDARGNVLGASKIARDITERKRAERALRQLKNELMAAVEELDRRVQERTLELERANDALLKEIAEQKRLQEQLRQSQKLEAIGTLAGGIAHDFNNILSIIRGYASLLGQQVSADNILADGLKVIDEAVEHGASVVRQLLTLARKAETRLVFININEVISDLTELLQQTFPKTIEVSSDLDPTQPFIMADPHQITQALLNLCVNARDAMPAGGSIALSTRVVGASEVQERFGSDGAERYVRIQVSDTGVGMDEGVRSRLFEPFFTTKGTGKGTGLGLAIVYGIVKNHNGFIDVESEPGRGATFRMHLPAGLSEEKPDLEGVTMKESPDLEQADGGKGTILLVEDEEAMARLLRQVMSQRGYQVLLARDGEEAIDLYRRQKHEIDVVLLDIGLPKIAGWDVMRKMKEENPSVNIVVASGHIEPELKSKMYRAGVKDFIHKPYLPDHVVDRLRALIQRP